MQKKMSRIIEVKVRVQMAEDSILSANKVVDQLKYCLFCYDIDGNYLDINAELIQVDED